MGGNSVREDYTLTHMVAFIQTNTNKPTITECTVKTGLNHEVFLQDITIYCLIVNVLLKLYKLNRSNNCI